MAYWALFMDERGHLIAKFAIRNEICEDVSYFF